MASLRCWLSDVTLSCGDYRLERLPAKPKPAAKAWSILSGKLGAAETARVRTLGRFEFPESAVQPACCISVSSPFPTSLAQLPAPNLNLAAVRPIAAFAQVFPAPEPYRRRQLTPIGWNQRCLRRIGIAVLDDPFRNNSQEGGPVCADYAKLESGSVGCGELCHHELAHRLGTRQWARLAVDPCIQRGELIRSQAQVDGCRTHWRPSATSFVGTNN